MYGPRTMQEGRFNCVLDAFWGSSGKGKVATWLADRYGAIKVSSSNFPNAGHSAVMPDGTKFVAKAIPTAAILKKFRGIAMECFISPGSGFHPEQFFREWDFAGRPEMFVHGRASLVLESHALREREGAESTKHIASTMQGSGVAIADKALRKPDVQLACNWDYGADAEKFFRKEQDLAEFLQKVHVVDPMEFRNLAYSTLESGGTWLHEGSQGYALSVDHGSHYPNCTSRNCTVQAALDHMAVPPQALGDVYLNLRTYPIRVGNVVENGEQVGFSGGFYEDCEELTWEQVAQRSGMPPEEAALLAERERTTVTKRVRRVCTFSFVGLRDAVRSNGATKLVLNFVQYLNWQDAGIRGEREAFQKLSKESRAFIDRVEEVAQAPVVLIGTGAGHDEMICRM